jgi:hypothetical protein
MNHWLTWTFFAEVPLFYAEQDNNTISIVRFKPFVSIYCNSSAGDHSQENVMNANGSFYSVDVVNQPKEIRTINTKRTKYFRIVPQESITGGKINGNIYVQHLLITDLGCCGTVLVCTIQVHPSVRLLVD